MSALVEVLAALALLLVTCLVFGVVALAVVGLGWLRGIWWKLAVVFAATALAAMVCLLAWPPRLGVDMRGGVMLVYDVRPPDYGDGDSASLRPDVMDQLVAAVGRRVNPGGTQEASVRAYGPSQIEIILPEMNEAELARAKNLISATGTLEFRILANRRDHQAIIDRAISTPDERLLDADGTLLAWWVPVAKGKEGDFKDTSDIAVRRTSHRGRETMEILVVKDPHDVSGAYLASVKPGVDDEGRPAIEFVFNAEGGRRFAGLTSENQPDSASGFHRKLGIILNGRLYSAPTIQSAIHERGEITGNFTQEEVDGLVDVLNAGALPAMLSDQPVMELVTGPVLPVNTLLRWTAVLTAILVLLHLCLVLVYRLAGLAAAAACLWNVLLIASVLMLLQAAWTLPLLLGLFAMLVVATACNLLVCTLVARRRRRGDDPATAVRNAWRSALVPIIVVQFLLFTAGECLSVFGHDAAKASGMILVLGSLWILFTSLFALQAFLQLAAGAVRGMEPAAMRLLFPTPAPPRDPMPTRKL